MNPMESKDNAEFNFDPSSITNFSKISEYQAKFEIQQNLLLEKALTSSDPNQILAAHNFLKKREESAGQQKAFLIAPESEFYNSNGFRSPIKRTTFEVLRRMARTHIPKIIINTRIDQIAGFAEFTIMSDQDKGWTIRKKNMFRNQTEKTENDANVQKIAEFMMNGGSNESKWDQHSFEETLRSVARDSLEVDQLCIECVYSMNHKNLLSFYPVDAATIRLINENDNTDIPINGYKTRYAQVWQDNIVSTFYPWEMSFGIRNSSTDIYTNGYGISELEDMVQIVTYLLYGVQYNGNFFSQGSNPKGFFSIEGNLSTSAINEFKQMWRNTISGVMNSHRVPVIEGGGKINWIDMQQTNRDMEFGSWMDFLMTIACCTFKIDPTECGFNIGKTGQIFGQDGQRVRLKHSQTKGLVPILKLIQRVFTRYVVEQLHPDYEFVFTGVEQEDKAAALDQDVKKVTNGFMSMQDGFEKWSGRDFDENKDIILNPIYQQIQTQKLMGGSSVEDGAAGVEEDFETMGPPPLNEDPFQKALINYVDVMRDRLTN